jgi:hypothetical protein
VRFSNSVTGSSISCSRSSNFWFGVVCMDVLLTMKMMRMGFNFMCRLWLLLLR